MLKGKNEGDLASFLGPNLEPRGGQQKKISGVTRTPLSTEGKRVFYEASGHANRSWGSAINTVQIEEWGKKEEKQKEKATNNGNG